MKHFFYTFFILVFFLQVTSAQRHKKFTYAGLDMGLRSDFFNVKDAGTELYTKNNFQSAHQGLFLEQELDYVWSVSTGLYFSKQKLDFRFRRDGSYSFHDPMRTIHIPLLLRANIPLTYGTPEIRFVPLLGAHGVFNLSQNRDVVKGRIYPNLADTYAGTIRRDISNVFFIAEGGANIDLMFAQGLIFSFGASYFKGFKTIMQADVTYTIAKVPNTGMVTSSGDALNTRIAIKYPVSRFWRKKAVASKKKQEKNKKTEG